MHDAAVQEGVCVVHHRVENSISSCSARPLKTTRSSDVSTLAWDPSCGALIDSAGRVTGRYLPGRCLSSTRLLCDDRVLNTYPDTLSGHSAPDSVCAARHRPGQLHYATVPTHALCNALESPEPEHPMFSTDESPAKREALLFKLEHAQIVASIVLGAWYAMSGPDIASRPGDARH
eukprot:1692213-Rhodomonas_salina.1